MGIAPIERVPGDRLLAWLERSYHGSMGYMARNVEKRLDLSLVFPGARSVVCVALLYPHSEGPDFGAGQNPTPAESSVQGSPSADARISHYARGEDYHAVMTKRLEKLLACVRESVPGAQGRLYVDTGPVLEKWWAAQAGVGWQGKHTNLLSTKLGSWFFLGELILDIELAFDAPVPDHCGTCTRCIDACPTQAIVEPYVLDASRCISYLTIELREDVPEDLRGPMGNMVFGCDICQEVCPWNRKAPDVTESDFRPAEGLTPPSLRELARLTPEEFRTRFKNRPILRAKWSGFMRSIAIALGNARDASAVPELRHLLSCDNEMVRRHAAWALDKIERGAGRSSEF